MAGKIKILVVSDPASIHAARFVMLLKEAGFDTRLFQSENTYTIDEHLKNTVVYVANPHSLDIGSNIINTAFPFGLSFNSTSAFFALLKRGRGIQRIMIDRCGVRERYKDLIRVIMEWRPQLVISLKMQNDGYTVSMAMDHCPTKFPWLHYCWGTDIEFFGKNKSFKELHLPKIKKLLSECDYLITDCKRDYRQAVDLGFKGKYLGTFIANGGFDTEEISKIRKNNPKEKIILVKGREGGLVGRAFIVLAALHKISQRIKGYKIKIIMATTDAVSVAKFLSQVDGVNYEIVPRLPYNSLLKLFAKSEITISASDVDGTPLFLAESMVLGCYPIHSDMESVREWIKDGENGQLFDVNSVNELASDILKVVNNQKLIKKADKINWLIAKKYFSRKIIRERIKKIIKEIL